MSPARRWAVAAGALALVVVGTTVALWDGDEKFSCSTPLPGHSPLLDRAGMAEQPDQRLDTLAAAAEAMGPPFGAVRAGVGYDYDQWLRLYGVNAGMLATTRNSAVITLLDDETLTPRWALRPSTKRVAWDADSIQFVLLGLANGKPTQLSSYDVAEGTRNWCVELPMTQADGEPVSTAFIADGADLIVALPDGSAGIRAARVSGGDGGTSWTRDLPGTDRADFIGMLPDDLFVAGGREEYRLAEPDASAGNREGLAAFSIVDGRRTWVWPVGAGEAAHVAGIVQGHVLVVLRTGAGTALVSLGPDGHEEWRRRLRGFAFQSTLRGDVLLARTRTGLTAYDGRTGEVRWQRAIPTEATYFPYGFTLGQMPSLDAGRVLMPTTTGLEILDVATGSAQRFPLPTDGVSTTYWPYQLTVSAGLIGIVTNTGAVVVDRD